MRLNILLREREGGERKLGSAWEIGRRRKGAESVGGICRKRNVYREKKN